jgi:integrase
MTAPLTARFVEKVKPDPNRRVELPDGALPGFYLVIQPSGAKSWAVRYRAVKIPKKFTIGPYPRLSLADAREQARAALRAVSEGRDPSRERVTRLQEVENSGKLRFGIATADFIRRYAKSRNRTWRETERLLTKADLASWQDRDIRAITRQDILAVLDRIVERGAPVQANRLLAALRRFFGWALERGLIETSPAASLRPPTSEIARDRVLSDEELGAIWVAADKLGFPFGPAVQLMILTGQRRSEVLQAQWREFDLARGLWSIPRERAKNDTGHVVPLAPSVITLVRGLPRIGLAPKYLFTTTGMAPFSGVSKAVARLQILASAQLNLQPWRLHDLRRTFATGCARLGVALHVVEKSLNHTSGTFSGIVAVYQRHDFIEERRKALDKWANHVLQLAGSCTSPTEPMDVKPKHSNRLKT